MRSLLLCASAIGGAATLLPACSSDVGRGEATDSVRAKELVSPAIDWPTWTFNGLTDMAPAAASWGPGRIDLFVRNTADGALWSRVWEGNTWGTWGSLGGSITSRPAAVSWGPNRLDVFARGDDGGLWHNWWEGGWGGWEPLGGTMTTDGPAVVSDGVGHLDIFVRRPDDRIGHLAYRSESGYGSWETIAGTVTSAPTVVSTGPGVFDLFARWSDDSLRTRHYPVEWGVGRFTFVDWGAWTNLGGVLTTAPTAARGQGYDSINVYALGTDSDVWQIGKSAVGWDSWRHLDTKLPYEGSFASEPIAVSPAGDTCTHLFARTSSNTVFHHDCGQSASVQIRSQRTGGDFYTTARSYGTSAYSSAQLGSIATTDPAYAPEYMLETTSPRELVAFDDDDVYDPAGSTSPWRPDAKAVSFATLAGFQRPFSGGFDLSPDPGAELTSRNISMVPRSLRVLDHGTCRVAKPWIKGWDSPYLVPPEGFLADLDDAIYKSFKSAADDSGAAIYPKARQFSPAFLRKGTYEAGDYDDGFALHVNYEIDKDVLGATATITVDVYATYKLKLVDGLIAAEPVGHIDVDVSKNAVATGVGIFKHLTNEDEVRASFQDTVPTQIHQAALDAAGQALGGIACDPTQPEALMAFCGTAKLGMFSALRDKMVTSGMSSTDAAAQADGIISRLDSHGFYCQGTDDKNPTAGVCKWHPVFQRIVVAPENMELVWYDGTTQTPDFAFARWMSSSQDFAICGAPSTPTRDPVRIPVKDFMSL